MEIPRVRMITACELIQTGQELALEILMVVVDSSNPEQREDYTIAGGSFPGLRDP
jgi:hypothetical protein